MMKKLLLLMLTLVMSVTTWAADPYFEVVSGSLYGSQNSNSITLKVTFPDATSVQTLFTSNTYAARLYYDNSASYFVSKTNNTGITTDGNSFTVTFTPFMSPGSDITKVKLEIAAYSIKLNGSYQTSTLSIYYQAPTPVAPQTDYFWIQNVSGSNQEMHLAYVQNIEYTTDVNGSWTQINPYVSVSLANNEKIYLRTTSIRNEVSKPFTAVGFDYNVGGDITTLLEPNGKVMVAKDFSGFFYGDIDLLDASELVLPSTTLSDGCYAGMFAGCENLTAAPVLPALQLEPYCYMEMFRSCTSLNSVTAYFVDWVNDATYMWLDGTSGGTLYCHPFLGSSSDLPGSWETSPLTSMNITVSEAGYTTFGYSTSNWVIPAGMEGYVAYIAFDGNFTFEKAYEADDIVDNKDMNLALVLKATPGTYTINFTDEVGQYYNNDLKTTNTYYDLNSDMFALISYYYAFSLDASGNNPGFYWMEDEGAPFITAPFKAYLSIGKEYFTNGVKGAFLFDEADGIKDVAAPEQQAEGIFDLSGRRVSNTNQKGIYIINGKKVIK